MKKLSQLAFTLIMIISLSLITGANTASAQSGDTDTSGSNGNSCVTLDNNMRYRMRDISVNNEVSDLQDYLIAEGYMTGNTTGFFGVATLKAVKSFQSANGLLSSGYVGPVTRAKIKSLSCDTANHNDGNTMYPTDPLVATKPVGCTREYRSCPDGSTMYRDANCGWHAEMCKGESVYKRLPSITNVIISDNDTMTIYGNNLDLARNINLAGSANPNIDISTSFSGAIITSSYIKLENIRAKLEKYIVYTENGYNMTITINNDTQGTTSNTFQFYVPAIKKELSSKVNIMLTKSYYSEDSLYLHIGSVFDRDGKSGWGPLATIISDSNDISLKKDSNNIYIKDCNLTIPLNKFNFGTNISIKMLVLYNFKSVVGQACAQTVLSQISNEGAEFIITNPVRNSTLSILFTTP